MKELSIAIQGYSSLDYCVNLSGRIKSNSTTLISNRLVHQWPRLGGSPIWVAKGLKHPSLKIQILSWIGEDSESDRYLNLIKQEGVHLKGIERIPQMRMPVSMMIYEIDGSSTCLYDSGGVDYPSLSNSQFKQLRNSEWLCLTVGPWENTKKSFQSIKDETKVALVFKGDEKAFPKNKIGEMIERCSLIFCNASEQEHLGIPKKQQIRKDQIVVVTQAGLGAKMFMGGEEQFYNNQPLKINDSTGAGDFFAGTLLKEFIKDETSHEESLYSAFKQTTSMLEARETKG